MFTKFVYTSLKGKDYLTDLGSDERIIIKCILEEQM
jgi:hypothetical protein